MKKILLLILLFSSFSVFADKWSHWTNITHIYPHSGGMTFITEYSNPDYSACDHGRRFKISIEHPNYSVMVSSLMAAFMADKKIYFNIDEQSKTCSPTINRFQVRR